MKHNHLTTLPLKRSSFSILKVCCLSLFILFAGCESEPDSFVPTGKMKVDGFECCDGDKDLNKQLLKEINEVKGSVGKLQNFDVAYSLGWNDDVTGYLPNMGHHFVNWSTVDGTFDHRNPEAMLFVPDEDGNWEFVAVEYLVLRSESPDPPEGFTGDLDHWEVIGPFWALHLWIKLENPDGIFHHTNSRLP
ncbi:hypothetical protein [Mangrovivirga cuniculi]|uniref:hypothetical protein n=1 Tax=Mangrovivirga cuniculi TaxID=2715131 RepID=UPI0010BE4803|nr:hypothetical protein [Mangrovivirga cuniculi]